MKRGFARGPLRLRPRAVHDRDGGNRRHRAAGDDVPGARRLLQGRRPPAHHARAEADRSAGGRAPQPLRHRGTGQAPRRRRPPGLRPDRARAHRPDAGRTGMARLRRAARRQAGSTASRISTARIISTASAIRTASSASGPTGRVARAQQAAASMGPLGPHMPCRTFPTMATCSRRPTPSTRSGWRPRRRAIFLNSTFTETPAAQARGPAAR